MSAKTLREVFLMIGAATWPAEERAQRLVGTSEMKLWEGLDFVQLQVGGIWLVEKRFYGLTFDVPSDDPVARILESYRGSGLPGLGRARATPLEAVVTLRDRLSDLSLRLDPLHYADFAEGYLPIEAASAWEYALRRQLRVLVYPNGKATATSSTLEELGISSWDEAMGYLSGFWKKFASEEISICTNDSQDRANQEVPEAWTAIVAY